MATSKQGERFTPSDNHWHIRPGLFYEHVTREQLRYVLLNCADPIIGGKLYSWKSRHVGAGIYKLWVEEWK
jgi:hypothetical protein